MPRGVNLKHHKDSEYKNLEGRQMGVLEGLEPKSVFRFFEEITRIPRGSGNERQISDYLKKFADDRGI